MAFCYNAAERREPMTARPVFLALLLLTGIAPAAADPHPRCFSMTEMNGWRSPDGKIV